MQYLSWLLSFLFHMALFVLLVQGISLPPMEPRDFLEVELTHMEPVPESEEIIAKLPTPPPVPEPELPEPTASPAPAPLPMDRTVVLDDSPPSSPAPVPEPKNGPLEPPSDIVEISPVKVPEPLAKPEERDEPRKIIVRKDDTVVHRGHEARFGRSMMADYYSYEATEFSGQFRTKDDRTISIIDARNTKYGRFLIYDSKHKTLRRLKQFGKYVYTIGPSVYEDEPVAGTVTFLAKDDRIERFILTTDDDRIAHYPRKVHVHEEETTFAVADGERSGYLSLPPHDGRHPGVVFVHGNLCTEPGLIRGFTRALSAREIASMSFLARGCESEGGNPGPDPFVVADTVSALAYFASLPQVEPGRVGLWGNGPGVPVAVKAAHARHVVPGFLVCLLDDSVTPEAMPDMTDIGRIPAPTLWIVTGGDVARWQPFISRLEAFRDKQGMAFTIVIAPARPSPDVLDARTDVSGWVENVTEDHARLAVSWIKNLQK